MNSNRWCLTVLVAVVPALFGQEWDIGGRAADAVAGATEQRLRFTFEQRGRYESRTGISFGKDPDLATGLYRTRVGATWTPVKWLRFSGMMQDSRAPWYGANAPSSVRDTADLHEAYIELFPSAKKGFGLTAGRMMLNYGEARLIGTPQWGNLARTYDQARVHWSAKGMRLEFLAISPVKIRSDEFNRPVTGDRIYGTYNTFTDFYRKNLLDFYVLRHEQNRPGGFTGGAQKDGTDKLGTTTVGLRVAGPLSAGVKYSLEAALQKGKVGPADLSASAWFGGLSRRWMIHGKPLDMTAEYKYASGTANPGDARHSGTFDQISPANHDKFGHQDLFGWRNVHNARSSATFGFRKGLAVSFLYDDLWLACLKDGIYNSSGKLIARSVAGSAGRHVGREMDLYGTYKYKHLTFGAGYGYLFTGGFLQRTTPGVNPTYLYIFHTYSL
jgi:Alginate export